MAAAMGPRAFAGLRPAPLAAENPPGSAAGGLRRAAPVAARGGFRFVSQNSCFGWSGESGGLRRGLRGIVLSGGREDGGRLAREGGGEEEAFFERDVAGFGSFRNFVFWGFGGCGGAAGSGAGGGIIGMLTSAGLEGEPVGRAEGKSAGQGGGKFSNEVGKSSGERESGDVLRRRRRGVVCEAGSRRRSRCSQSRRRARSYWRRNMTS